MMWKEIKRTEKNSKDFHQNYVSPCLDMAVAKHMQQYLAISGLSTISHH